jgi:undecaprenyl-diphosphatase
MNELIIFCAKYLIYLVIVAAFIYWLTLPKKSKLRSAVFGVITILVAFVLAKIGGGLFYNARPFVSDHVTALFKYPADNGFPSDHTLITASIGVTIFAISKKWGSVLLVAAIIIGLSRVLAHVHHPVDILASILFAIVGGIVAYYATPKVLPYVSKVGFVHSWLH